MLEHWATKDPLENYQEFLKQEGILTDSLIISLKEEIVLEINKHLQIAFNEEHVILNLETELKDVFKQYQYKEFEASVKKKNNRLIDAISEGLYQSLEKHDNLVIMGQDIAEYGGAFKITDGFVQKFGKERIRNTPICESAIVSTAYGLSVNGIKSIVEMQFSDFVSIWF